MLYLDVDVDVVRSAEGPTLVGRGLEAQILEERFRSLGRRVKFRPDLRYGGVSRSLGAAGLLWPGGGHQRNAIIANPYLPETVKNIVVRNREDPTDVWLSERRNVLQDYKAAFGNTPDDFIWAVALFIDNDQTKEDAAAQFTKADSFCR